MWQDFKDKIKTKSFRKDTEELFSRVTKATMLDNPEFIKKYDDHMRAKRESELKTDMPDWYKDNAKNKPPLSSTYVERLDPPYCAPVVIKPVHDATSDSLSSRTRQLFSDFNEGATNE